MITLEEIDRRGYRFVFGDRSFVANEPDQAISLFAPHVHTTFSDGIDGPDKVVYTAAELGIDAITLTDHDTNEGNVEFAEVIKSYGLDHYQGVEYTSFVETDNGLVLPAHMIGTKREKGTDNVLVLPDEIVPPEEFNVAMYEQNAARTGPHPAYGHDSLTVPVIRRIQSNPDPRKRLDLIEIDNGAVRQAEIQVDSYGPLGWLLRRTGNVPLRGGNEEAIAIYEDLQDPKNSLHPVKPVAGPDSHREQDVPISLVGYRRGKNPVVEAEAGKIVILALDAIAPYSVRELRDVRRRGRTVDRDWRARLAQQNAHGSGLKRVA